MRAVKCSTLFYEVARGANVAQTSNACLNTISDIRQSQAPTMITFFIKHLYMKIENNYKALVRKKRLEARVTDEEYNKATVLAEECGLSMSDYIRRVALGQHPRRRLSSEEVKALSTLADARGDLMRIVSAIRGIEAKDRGKYFGNTDFVKIWMAASEPLIKRLSQILDYVSH